MPSLRDKLTRVIACAPSPEVAAQYVVLLLENACNVSLGGNGYLDDDPAMYPYGIEDDRGAAKAARGVLNKEMFAVLRYGPLAGAVRDAGADEAFAAAVAALEAALLPTSGKDTVDTWTREWIEAKRLARAL